MNTEAASSVPYSVIDLADVRYAVLPETRLLELCRQAGRVACAHASSVPAQNAPPLKVELDQRAFARRLVLRRRRAGLTQAELARRAGVRAETLNRLERGKTTPDFATVRKLVVAMNRAEADARPPLIEGVNQCPS